MKESKNKIIIIIAVIVSIIGIAVIIMKGFNFDLSYREGKRIELNIGKDFEKSDIEEISKEILEKEVIVQKIEIYEDAATIFAEDITEEQRNKIVEKINEKYGKEIKSEDTKIITVPHIKLRDIITPYIIPFSIVTILILIYIAIRYMKLNGFKVLLKTLLAVILSQVVLFSIMAITRIPIGRLTIPIVLAVYMLSLVCCTNKLEQQILELKEEDKE